MVITPGAPSVVVGRAIALTAETRGASGAVLANRAVAWSTSDSLVVRVSTAGVVTGVARGSATVTAASEGRTGTTTVTVLPVPVATITVGAAAPFLPVGATLAATATLRDSAGQALTDREVVWSTSDGAVAAVSPQGVVTARAPGRVTLTAASGGAAGTLAVHVVFAQATADLAAPPSGAKSQSGLMHGLDPRAASIPPRTLIDPLRPRLWRSTPGVVPPELAAAVGARYQYILSDAWGYPVNGWPNGRPWERPDAYRALTREALQPLSGRGPIAEIWNEPDPAFGPNFWDGSELQFFQTYLAGYRAAREALGPSALVAGPSLSRHDLDYLKRFADFCVRNGCEANVLTWHETGADRPLSVIADHLATVRREIAENPAYAALRVRELHVNASVGPLEQYNPAASLTYLRYLELGGADASARACWADSAGAANNCFNNSLGGLITPGGSAAGGAWRPRGVWWAYKAYADGQPTRVPSTVSDVRMLALASTGGGGADAAAASPLLLVGYSAAAEPTLAPATPLGVVVRGLDAIPALRGRARVRVRISEIPNTGEQPLDAPAARPARDVDVSQGAAAILIEDARRDAVYAVVLEAAP